MARQKKPENRDLPRGCDRLPSGSIRYRAPGRKPVVIADKHTPINEVFAIVWELENNADKTTIRAISQLWYEHHNFSLLKPRTQSDYRECEARPAKAFEDFDVSQITPADVFEYLTHRGKESIRRANYELVWLRHVLNHAVSIGLIPTNPAREIKPLKAPRKRRRGVSDLTYAMVYSQASDPVRVAMEISYCTGIRQGDVLKLRWEDIGQGVRIVEGKTDKEYMKHLTPRLRKALELAKRLPGQPFGGWVVRNRHGNQYTSKGFQANWKRALSRVPEHRKFTFHDIRRKAITDIKGDKQAFSMHSDAKMLGVYDLSITWSPSH